MELPTSGPVDGALAAGVAEGDLGPDRGKPMSADLPTAERGGFDALAAPVRPAVPDHDLATATRALVSSYAPGLGLDPGRR